MSLTRKGLTYARMQTIFNHTLDNGLTLVAESMDWLESAAFSLLMPMGCNRDPADRIGLANLTCEMVQRGCGPRDSRQFIADLELLGADTSASVSNAHTSFGGAMPADSLFDALAIYADVVRRPHLPEEQLEDARLSCIQEIRSVEDDLPQRVFQQLRLLRYGDPLGRSSQGTVQSVEQIALDDVRRAFEGFGPDGAILSVAGKIDWPRLKEKVEELFGSWNPQNVTELAETPSEEDYLHLPHTSSQTHIGIAYGSVPYANPDYYQARGAVGVLSDGMSSRLFTEVRERRGLCYAVFASCHSLRDRGSVLCYAGTTTERAQQTMDVLVTELTRLADGVEQGELDRLKAKIKSGLIMQQESSTTRSSAIAADWYYLDRVQPLEELKAILDGLTCETINRYLKANPPADFKVVTLGQTPLEARIGVS